MCRAWKTVCLLILVLSVLGEDRIVFGGMAPTKYQMCSDAYTNDSTFATAVDACFKDSGSDILYYQLDTASGSDGLETFISCVAGLLEPDTINEACREYYTDFYVFQNGPLQDYHSAQVEHLETCDTSLASEKTACGATFTDKLQPDSTTFTGIEYCTGSYGYSKEIYLLCLNEFLTLANALTGATKTSCVTYVTDLISCVEEGSSIQQAGVIEPLYYDACSDAFDAIKADDPNNDYIQAEDNCWGPTTDLYAFYEFTYDEFQNFKTCVKAIPRMDNFPDACSGYYDRYIQFMEGPLDEYHRYRHSHEGTCNSILSSEKDTCDASSSNFSSKILLGGSLFEASDICTGNYGFSGPQYIECLRDLEATSSITSDCQDYLASLQECVLDDTRFGVYSDSRVLLPSLLLLSIILFFIF